MAERTAGAVLVTGASRGLGRAVALHLAEAGFSVFAGVRKPEHADALAAADGVEPVLLDVSRDASIEAARERIDLALGGAGLRGVVNNAGVATPGPLEFTTRADLTAQFEVNLFGAVSVIRTFLPQLRHAGGRIVNIGAANARLSMPTLGVLSACKAGLEAISDALRVELSGSGVSVSIVEPGMTYAESEKAPYAASLRREIAAAIERLPEPGRDHYTKTLLGFEALGLRSLARAAPPVVVARRVHHALTARRPRTRYWCGVDGKMAALLGRFGPDRFRDALWRRVLGI
jgi:NAD(P)-dependent dehydrogenase (short-subunit alcohol dehydrogenase family)